MRYKVTVDCNASNQQIKIAVDKKCGHTDIYHWLAHFVDELHVSFHVLYDHICTSDRFTAAVVVHLPAAVPPVRSESCKLWMYCASGKGLSCGYRAHRIGAFEIDLQEAHPRQARLPLDAAVLVVAVRHTPVL